MVRDCRSISPQSLYAYVNERCFQPRKPCPPVLLEDGSPVVEQLKGLVHNAALLIFKRGLPAGIELNGLAELEERLWEVLNNGEMIWLTLPLMQGLMSGKSEDMNQRTHPSSGEPFPILHWLVQFEMLKAELGYSGKEDMIALALHAGASVHGEISNKCTAHFFAMKYSSARAVELLLDAGAEVDHKDIWGHSIWKNAIERPDPQVVIDFVWSASRRLGAQV